MLNKRNILFQTATILAFSQALVASAADAPAAKAPPPTYETPRIGLMLQMDMAAYDDTDQIDNNSGTEMRRGRFSFSGKLEDQFNYRLEIEMFGSSGSEITDAYIRYNTSSQSNITFGHFKIPFSLEQTMSDKTLVFMERSLGNSFLKSRAPGLMFSSYDKSWSAAAMLFGEQLYNKTDTDEGGGFSTRLTWAPYQQNNTVLHAGISAQFVLPSQQTSTINYRYSTRPESHITSVKTVDTGLIGSDGDGLTLLGVEAAAAIDNVLVSAELMQSSFDTDSGDSLSFSAWYIQASYTLTGEIRAYNRKNGTFKGIMPAADGGAWEVGMRYSEIDLNEDSISGGLERNLTLAVNYSMNPYIRISANWVHVISIDEGPYDGEEVDALQMRFQFIY